jgi:DNA-binding CsgD family transcriptional regulator
VPDIAKDATDLPLHLVIAVCDCIALPLFLVDQDARVIWRNQSARVQAPFHGDFDGEDATDSILQRRLRHHVRAVASWPSDRIEVGLDVLSESNAELVRIPIDSDFLVLVRIMRNEDFLTPTLRPRLARFGLTPTERVIAEQMLSGRTTMEIAKNNAITLQTVRTHIKRVYSKLGVHCREKLALKLQSH